MIRRLVIGAFALIALSGASAQTPAPGVPLRWVPPSIDSFRCRVDRPGGGSLQLDGRVTQWRIEGQEQVATVKMSSDMDDFAGDYRATWLASGLLMRRGGIENPRSLNQSLLLFEPDFEGEGQTIIAIRTRVPTTLGAPQRLTGSCTTISNGGDD